MAQPVSTTWEIDTSRMRRWALQEQQRRFALAKRAAEDLAPQITDWLRDNAEWVDDTGAARASLECVVLSNDTRLQIVLRGGGPQAPHMIFLEFDHAGRFSIIEPGMEFWIPIIRARLRDAMSGRGR